MSPSADAPRGERVLMNVNAGEGLELCLMLMERLGVPRTARWFEVRFELGQSVQVACAYFPEATQEQQKVKGAQK